MANDVHADRTTSLEETDGVVTSLTRVFRVTDVTGSDYNKAFTALNAAGIPAFNSSPSGLSNLVLTRRSVSLVGSEKDAFDVTCEYQIFGTAEVDRWFSGSTTLQQISTENDNSGNQILLEHTYPDDDPDFGINTDFNPTDTPVAVKQGGEISVFSPTSTITSTHIQNTNSPTNIALGWVGHVNSKSWGGSGTRQWMCTDVSHESLDIDSSPEQWKMTFEFQYKSEGWTPTALFIDPRTGRPPQNLIDDEGIKDIFWHPERDFNTLFPT